MMYHKFSRSEVKDEHLTHVQGHKVKYSDRNNTAVDGSISLKFGTEFHHVTDYTP